MFRAMEFETDQHRFGAHLEGNVAAPMSWTLNVYFSMGQAEAVLREITEGREECALFGEELPKESRQARLRLVGPKARVVGFLLDGLYRDQPNFAVPSSTARLVVGAFPQFPGESAFLSWIDEESADHFIMLRSKSEGESVIRGLAWLSPHDQETLLTKLYACTLPELDPCWDNESRVRGGFAEIANKALLYYKTQSILLVAS